MNTYRETADIQTQRHTHRKTDSDAGRQRHRQRCKHRDILTEIHTYIQETRNTNTGWETYTQTETGRHTDIQWQTYRQAGMQTQTRNLGIHI